MPRILVTEAEKQEIMKQREVRAAQALAWNEAIEVACLEADRWMPEQYVKAFTEGMQKHKRVPNGLT